MATEKAVYTPAHEVAATAVPLIAEYHQRLADVPIVYVFRSPASRARGRIVLGRASRVVGLNAFLAALAGGDATEDLIEAAARSYGFFVMEIAHQEWWHATQPEQVALVDHELCHFDVDPETGELKIRPHDLEEFNAVVARHGAWSSDVAVFLAHCSTPAPA